MFEMLLSAFILGIMITIPPGPVMIAAGKRAITHGFAPAFVFTAGSMAADLFYVSLVYIGLAPLLTENVILRFALWTIGGAWLLYLGWDAVRTKISFEDMQTGAQPSVMKEAVAGVGITLFNPLVIVSWIALAGNFFANWGTNWPPQNSMGWLAILGIMTGVLAYVLVYLKTLSSIRRFISPRILTVMSASAGAFLMILGLGAWQSALAMLL